MIRTASEWAITRRRLIRGGVACALGSTIPTGLFSETILQDASTISSSRGATSPLQSELYAFRGARHGLTAIAATWVEARSRDCIVRIHAGAKAWQFEVPAHRSRQSLHKDDYSLFVGNVVAPAKTYGGIMSAVVIEIDARTIGQRGPAEIWAERMVGGLRQRIGAPFLSNIMRDHTELASLYHTSSPDRDRVLLRQPLSVEIARRLRVAGSVADPDFHARRLAYALLPDVLLYDSRLPTGFTFAAQNGRHPSESTHEVVGTILNGGKSPKPAAASPRPFVSSFPYFEQLTTV